MGLGGFGGAGPEAPPNVTEGAGHLFIFHNMSKKAVSMSVEPAVEAHQQTEVDDNLRAVRAVADHVASEMGVTVTATIVPDDAEVPPGCKKVRTAQRPEPLHLLRRTRKYPSLHTSCLQRGAAGLQEQGARTHNPTPRQEHPPTRSLAHQPTHPPVSPPGALHPAWRGSPQRRAARVAGARRLGRRE